MSLKYKAIRAAFEVLWAARAPALMRRLSSCRGVIFTLHRVLPDEPRAFSPNGILQIRPDFLDYVLERLRALDIDLVSLDEAMDRLKAEKPGRKFAVITFDDGYRDNLVHALPILRKHACPFTLYVPTAFIDGTGELWWQALEDLLAVHERLTVTLDGAEQTFEARTTEEKQASFAELYWYMRRAPEADRIALLTSMCEFYGLDLSAHCRSLIMDWNELRQFSSEPLCTIGAHTVNHYELAKLAPEDARIEMVHGIDVIGAQFGKRPRHLSYPLGGPLSADDREFRIAGELDLDTAVTTRPGGLYRHHLETPMQLPRVSLNGLFQNRRYVDVFSSGAIFTMLGRVGAG
ncbi:hypothetical protein GCM10007989_36130 [Devosia pacifica]|uniref:Chitooligosaccharide deacetylase n=1 Tax=Devosia pacifica TaxID=1335967 RepID=A0A918SFP9_9HYPH|nr:polysaccharide deacetylase family protein [Devosia pacifica]GHA36774.1 hypothetical protein GCM10007989_36130 [Devosia pacifica]